MLPQVNSKSGSLKAPRGLLSFRVVDFGRYQKGACNSHGWENRQIFSAKYLDESSDEHLKVIQDGAWDSDLRLGLYMFRSG